MLTRSQLDFYHLFGFLVTRQVFSTEEMQAIIEEAEAVWQEDRDGRPDAGEHQWFPQFMERRPQLAQLAEDDRIYTAIEQLLGPGSVWCGSEGHKGSFNEQGAHFWHTDLPSQKALDYDRIKVMLYLRPTRQESGALRVIPGSHIPPLYDVLHPLNQQTETTCQEVLGIPGPDLPCYAVESEPGNVVFFNQRLYHGVYGKQPGRRYLCLKYADRPVTESQIALLRTGSVFTIHDTFRSSDRPRIRSMVDALIEIERTERAAVSL